METGAWRGEVNDGHPPRSTSGRNVADEMIEPTSPPPTKA
jgi:hypothetical protein